MKRYLPIGLLVVGVLIVGGAFLFLRGGNEASEEEETALRELSAEEIPFASLTPSEDGHWLSLRVKGISVDGAYSMDYELLYKVADGRTQGVPGTVKLSGIDSIDRELLLGSESSGKFRYDEGVDAGTLTLRFRDEDGRLIAKLSSDFSLLSGADVLATPDGEFKYKLDNVPRGVFFVVMDTFARDEGVNIGDSSYAIFASDGKEYLGEII